MRALRAWSVGWLQGCDSGGGKARSCSAALANLSQISPQISPPSRSLRSQQIDLDKSGSIDLKELMAALKMIDKSATEEQVNKRIAKYDSDKDGKVNLEEYEKLVYRWGKDEAEFNK